MHPKPFPKPQPIFIRAMSVDECSISSTSTEKGGLHWWHACIHIFVSILGIPGIATLPYTLAYLGWWLGVGFFIFVTASSYYSARLLIQLQRSDQATYANIADSIMGPGFAAYFVRPFQFLVLYQVTIITALTIGQAFLALQQVAGHVPLTLPWCVTLGGVVVILTTLVPSIGDMWWLSPLGGLSAIAFTVMACLACATDLGGDVAYGQPEEGTDYVFGVLNSFGILAFSYGGHSVLPDVQASLGAGEDAQRSMQKALGWSFALVVPCYLAAAVMAYLAFGEEVSGYLPDNLRTRRAPAGFFLALNLMLILNSISLGAIYIQAGFNLIEDAVACLRPRSFLYRFTMLRLPWVGTATFIAVALPFFGDLAGLSGAIGFTPMTFIFPFLLWERSDLSARAPWWRHALHVLLCIIFCIMGIVGFAGALYLVIRDSSNFHLFS